MRTAPVTQLPRFRKISLRLFFITLTVLILSAPLLVRVSAERGNEVTIEAISNRNTALDQQREDLLGKLSAKRRSGQPFAIQEIEILDAFEAGLSIETIEADLVISRAFYDVYVAGKPPNQDQRDLLNLYRANLNQHVLNLVARNAQMNANFPSAIGISAPDESRDWELYSDPELFNQLSSAYQHRLQRIYGYRGKVRTPVKVGSNSLMSPELAPQNTLVNNRTADNTTQDTQSETTILLGAGNTIISAFNDSGSNVGSASHFTGIARSTDLGNTWLDQGILPNDANGDAGDPILARSNSTGTIILATLGFNSAATLPTFRSTNDGVSYLSQVDADGGGGNNDKEWLTCDNFAGTGQGNFYLFYRDFAGGTGGMSFTRSTDNGLTWSARQVLASTSGQGALVTVGADHAVYCFWLATGNQLVFRKSVNQGVSFGAQTAVATLRTAGVNGELGLNGGFRTNAFMQVVPHPTDANQLYAIWNDKGIPPSTDKANVYLSQTTNGGTNWSTPIQLNTDAGTNDQFFPCIAITPNGTGLFVSWYDRRLSLTNTLIDVFGRNATISGTTLTFGVDYRITDTAFPVVIGQDNVIVATYMGDYDMAVADNTNFYRTWGDNRLSLLTHANQPDVRFTKVPLAGPGPIPTGTAQTLVAENCTPANNAIDPGEQVTVSLAVTNVGTAATTNLVGTLQTTGGIANPSAPATYGAIAPGATVSRNFQFTAGGTCGGTVTPTLQLQDGPTNFGTLTYSFALGVIPTQTFSNPAAITINDNAAAAPYPSNISVSGVSTYNRVTLTLNGLSHTFPEDIDIIVVAPGAQKAYVISDVGGGTDVTGLTITLDDNAAVAFGTGTLSSGTFKPSNIDTSTDVLPAPAPAGPYATTFAGFSGLGAGANGTWSLYVRDDVGQDTGSISGGWSLGFVGNPTCNTSCGPTASNSSISGAITDMDGSPLGGVEVALSNGERTITRADGRYQFDELPTGEFYTVTPQMADHTFTPRTRSFSLLGNRTDASFSAQTDSGQAANAIDTAMYFVRQQYLDFLGREPDEGGLQYWTSQISACGEDIDCTRKRRVEVSAAFFASEEFQQTGSYIYRLYSGALGRPINHGEFSSDRAQVVAGANLGASKRAYAEAFVQRPEFVTRYQANTTAESFVDAMIRNVASTGADLSSERNNLVALYNSGTTMSDSRGLVVRVIGDNAALTNATYNSAFVLMEYYGYLRREIDQGGYDFWQSVLNNRQQGNYRGMVCAFISSAEYQRRFGSFVTRSDHECGR